MARVEDSTGGVNGVYPPHSLSIGNREQQNLKQIYAPADPVAISFCEPRHYSERSLAASKLRRLSFKDVYPVSARLYKRNIANILNGY